MRTLRFNGIIIALLLLITVCHADDSYIQVVETAEEAADIAQRLSGFGRLKTVDGSELTPESAELVVMRDSTTPFISDSIDGRVAWRVQYPAFGKQNGQQRLRPFRFTQKTCEMFIDSTTGRLLKAILRSVKGQPDNYPEPGGPLAEELLERSSEMYHGLPNVTPALPHCRMLPKVSLISDTFPHIRGYRNHSEYSLQLSVNL